MTNELTLLLLTCLPAFAVGLLMGIMGGGGTALTLPLLVYGAGLSPVTATSYSMFVVGMSSLVGAVGYIRSGEVNFKAVAAFALPSVTGTLLTRRYLIPALPHTVDIGSQSYTTEGLLMGFFALLMLVSAYTMIKPASKKSGLDEPIPHKPALLLIEGGILGVLTGLVGAGGGFLTVPSLVAWAGLKIRQAIGTSLAIISINTLIGFAGDATHMSYNAVFLLAFTGTSILGVWTGLRLSRRVHGKRLKPAFGVMLIIMAMVILAKELI